MDGLIELTDAGCDVQSAETFRRIERAIAFLRDNRHAQPALPELAAYLGLSASQTQRLFSRWAGISPKRFLQFLTVEYAKSRMRETGDLLGLALDSGLSGPGRLHDLFVNMEAMSPGEFKQAAAGADIRYGFGDSPFGQALVAFTARGICHLSFVAEGDESAALQALTSTWSQANWIEDTSASGQLLKRIFAAGQPPDGNISLWVSGTNFQIQVWRAMLQIPSAGLLSYRQLADLLGMPKAARAVGSAVARNPVAFLIPCHRVLRESGEFGIYHWGRERKMAMCGWESAVEELAINDRGRPGGAGTRA